MAPTPSKADLDALTALVSKEAIVSGEDKAPFLTEWRGRWEGEAPLILAPSSTQELSAVMAEAYARDIAIVPQGGNTGLVGAQVPFGQVLISTKRLTKIRDVSPEDFTITVEAGVPLATVQDAAKDAGRLFPLSIGSEGSCQIGGNLSSNAGGVQVLRYGNMRDLCLGLEAVLPNGEVWSGLNSLRKNNTGYDLKHLFIGGEGTLGIITAAVLKLVPQPAETVTAFLAVPSADAAVSLLSFCQDRTGGQITSFELMNAATVELILHHFEDLPRPVESRAPFYVLMELTAGRKGTLQGLAEELLGDALQRELITDGTIAASLPQADALWQLRHNASAAMKRDPLFCVKCDVSVPIAAIPAFLEGADAVVEEATPGARVIAFGHLGDGNIHYDILGPQGADDSAWRDEASRLEHLVHDVVIAHAGSISAEHGIGILKRDELAERKSLTEMNMMRAIKAALDPKGLMNPGKLL